MKEYIERETLLAWLENLNASRYLINSIEDKNRFPAENVKPIEIAYWDWQWDGTHFCSNCGHDALFYELYENYFEEKYSKYCPYCGRVMTHIENPKGIKDKEN